MIKTNLNILIAIALLATARAQETGEMLGPLSSGQNASSGPAGSAAMAANPSPTPSQSPVESPQSAAPSPSPSASPIPAASPPAPDASPSPTASPTLLSHHWIVDQRQSVMDDSVTITFSLLGVRDSATDHPTNDLLIVRLREGKWDVMVSTNHEFMGDQFPPARIRWDNNPPENELWLSSSDFTAAFCPTPRKFIAQARASSRLVVRLFPKFAGESTVVFDLSGLAAEMDKHPLAREALVEPTPTPTKKAKKA